MKSDLDFRQYLTFGTVILRFQDKCLKFIELALMVKALSNENSVLRSQLVLHKTLFCQKVKTSISHHRR